MDSVKIPSTIGSQNYCIIDSVIVHDQIINAQNSVSTKVTNTIPTNVTSTVSINSDDKK